MSKTIEIQIGKFSIIVISTRCYAVPITVKKQLANLDMDKRDPMLLTQKREATLDVQKYKVNLEVEKQWL